MSVFVVVYCLDLLNHESQQRQRIHCNFSSENRRCRRLRPVSGGSPSAGGGWWPHLPYDPWEDAACLSLWRCLITFFLSIFEDELVTLKIVIYLAMKVYVVVDSICQSPTALCYGVFTRNTVWYSVYCSFKFLQPSIFQVYAFGMVKFNKHGMKWLLEFLFVLWWQICLLIAFSNLWNWF